MNPPTPIDYDSLAKQAGGTPVVDYDALAAQSGGTAQTSHADVMHGEIKNAPGGLSGWLSDLENDIRNGTGNTLPGRVLQAAGAPGIDKGTTPQTAETVAGPLIGPVHVAQGLAEGLPEQISGAKPNPVEGLGKVISGTAQATGPLSAFVAPEVGEELPEAAQAAYVNFAHRVLPSAMKEDAGALFQSIAKDANSVPVSLDKAGDAALKLMDWQKKTQLGPTINKFLNRITSPKQGPLTYEEGRDFYSLLSKMSADETSKLAGPVKYQVQQLTAGLRQDLGNSAEQVGRAADYYKAMGDYARAANLQQKYEFLQDKLVKGALAAGYGGAAATAGKLAYDYFTQK